MRCPAGPSRSGSCGSSTATIPTPRSSRFADVAGSPWWEPHVERLAELGVTAGCGTNPLRFCPDRSVNRAQMASFLARAFDLPSGPDAGFTDVTAGSTHSDDINALSASGITAGCRSEPLRYCPARATTRAQMATFLHRATNVAVESGDIGNDIEIDDPDLYLAETTDTKNIAISVYYCGNNSNYDLGSRVTMLNSIVSDFFTRESRGASTITFVRGANGEKILGTDIDWNAQDTTLAHWLRDINDNRWKDPCREEAKERADHQNVLVLADIRTGPGPNNRRVFGFAKRRLGGTPAIVATANNRTGYSGYYTAEDMFLGTVAHEIGHAYYRWQHTFDYANETLEMQESLMSYFDYDSRTGVVSGAKRNVRGDAPQDVRAYVACIQRKERNWIEKAATTESCAARPTAPGIPSILGVTPGDRFLDISWETPNDGGSSIAGYDLWYRPSDSGDDVWSKTTSKSTELRLRGLDNGTTYYIAVRARNDVDNSAWSRTVEGTPRSSAAPPPPLTVTLAVGDGAQREQGADGACIGVHCHWLHVDIIGFDSGPHTLVCAHNGVPDAGFSRGAYRDVIVRDWPSTDDCLFGYPGSEVFVIVDPELRDGVWYGGTYSNTIVWPDCNRELARCDRQSTAPPPAGIINDNPVLDDQRDTYSWFKPPADIDRLGYGNNGFHFTLAIGNEDDRQLDNRAIWEFDEVDSEYAVQAYIPTNWATAHAQYLIWVDGDGDRRFSSNEYVDGPWLNQEDVSGWQTIGTYDLNGRVRIEVRDVRTRDDWNDVGPVYARLAVDAIRLVPTDGSGEPPGSPTGVAFRDSLAVWDAVVGADSYDIQECVSGSGVSGCLIHQDVDCCQFALDRQSTSFRVRTVNSSGTSDWSPRVQVSVPPSECRSVTNDDPRLYDEEAPYSWWEPPPEIAQMGHGGDFHFTLAVGNSDDDEMDNWASWEFDSVQGRCEVQAWIPADWATAHVQYLIWADENGDGRFTGDDYVAGPWLDQQQVSGWQSLGTYDLDGRVRIEVRDTRTRDDHRDDGPVNTRLAVDAIRLR